ncbi:hypothetical protein IA69_32185 [Massilia sp. JS1662]|nr:hypothetical protein IA69_32185 [Massilia sp. JS1662]
MEVGLTIQPAWTVIPASASCCAPDLAENFASDPTTYWTKPRRFQTSSIPGCSCCARCARLEYGNFAARQLQGISPETLVRLRKVIDERLGSGGDDGGS